MARKRMATKDAALDRRIGFTVYRERRRQGMTVPDLATRAGVHENTVHRVENGQGVSVGALFKIARALHVSMDVLARNPPDIVGFPSSSPLFD